MAIPLHGRDRVRKSVALVSVAFALVGFATRSAVAQPILTVDRDVVVPGTSVTATIVGAPGLSYALVGSSAGSGASHAGVSLSVGTDLVILAVGTFAGTDVAEVTVTPPFLTTSLDRYYIQAAVSLSPSFNAIQVSAGRVLRNADLVGGLSKAYAAGNSSVIPLPWGAEDVQVVAETVPAGRYVVLAQIAGRRSYPTLVFCHVQSASGGLAASSFAQASGDSNYFMNLLGWTTLPTSGQLTLRCTSVDYPSEIVTARLVALRVDAIQ